MKIINNFKKVIGSFFVLSILLLNNNFVAFAGPDGYEEPTYYYGEQNTDSGSSYTEPTYYYGEQNTDSGSSYTEPTYYYGEQNTDSGSSYTEPTYYYGEQNTDSGSSYTEPNYYYGESTTDTGSTYTEPNYYYGESTTDTGSTYTEPNYYYGESTTDTGSTYTEPNYYTGGTSYSSTPQTISYSSGSGNYYYSNPFSTSQSTPARTTYTSAPTTYYSQPTTNYVAQSAPTTYYSQPTQQVAYQAPASTYYNYTQPAPVTPQPAPACNFTSLSPRSQTITLGNSVNLTWNTSNTSYVTISGGSFSNSRLSSSGSYKVYPTTSSNTTTTVTYTFTCYNSQGIAGATQQSIITVINPTCNNGATNYPYCNNQCVEQAPQTQQIACGNGQNGYITQQKSYSCATRAWSSWTTVSNNCSTPIVQTCNNGATNYPYCNNNVSYVYCSGVAHIAPYTCPTTYIPPVYNYVTTPIYYNYTQPKQTYNYNYTYTQAPKKTYTTNYSNTSSYVTTNGATSVGSNSAQLNGSWNTNGNGGELCQAYFVYGTNSNYLSKSTAKQAVVNNNSTISIGKAIYNLNPNTTYYYKTAVTCLTGTKYGAIKSFTTSGLNYTKTYSTQKKKYITTPVYNNNVSQPISYTKAGTPVYSNTQFNNSALVTYGTNNNTNVVYENSGENYVNNNQQVENINSLTTARDYINLSIQSAQAGVKASDLANYKINFVNISNAPLSNVAVRIILPNQMTIYNADKGQWTKGGTTLIYPVAYLHPGEGDLVNLTVLVGNNVLVSDNLTVNAYAQYSLGDGNNNVTPNEVTTYSTLPVISNNNSNPVNNVATTTNFMSLFSNNIGEWAIVLIALIMFIAIIRFLFGSKKTIH
jgi:hypothetical protein